MKINVIREQSITARTCVMWAGNQLGKNKGNFGGKPGEGGGQSGLLPRVAARQGGVVSGFSVRRVVLTPALGDLRGPCTVRICHFTLQPSPCAVTDLHTGTAARTWGPGGPEWSPDPF